MIHQQGLGHCCLSVYSRLVGTLVHTCTYLRNSNLQYTCTSEMQGRRQNTCRLSMLLMSTPEYLAVQCHVF